MSYFAALVLFACSLMSKPMLVTLPFVLLLLDYWPLGRWKTGKESKVQSLKSKVEEGTAESKVQSPKSKVNGNPKTPPLYHSHAPIRRLALEKLPFLALATASSVITFQAQATGHSVSLGLPLDARVENAIVSYLKYLSKTIWPVDLAIFYPHHELRGPASDPLPEWQFLAAAAVLAAVTVPALVRLRRERWFATGWFWYLGTLVPVIGIVQVGGQAMADRYTYIPLIGVFICLVWSTAEFFTGRRFGQQVLGATGVLVVLACGAATRSQVKYWRNNLTISQHALAVTRDNAPAHHNLGVEFAEQGKYDLAIEQFRAAVEADPYAADAYYSLGCVLVAQNKLDEAIEQFQAALRVGPWHALSHNSLGAIFWKLDRREDNSPKRRVSSRSLSRRSSTWAWGCPPKEIMKMPRRTLPTPCG